MYNTKSNILNPQHFSRLLEIAVLQKGDRPLKKVFTSFQNANTYFQEEAQHLPKDPNQFRTYSFTIRWENEHKVTDFIPLHNEDAKQKKILEPYVQMILEDIVHIATGKTMTDIIATVQQPGWLIDHMGVNRARAENAMFMLSCCEGLDERQYIQEFQQTQDALHTLKREYPLLEAVEQVGAEALRQIGQLENRSFSYIEEALTFSKHFLSKGIEKAFEQDTAGVSNQIAKISKFKESLLQDQVYLDERFTSFGQKLYNLSDRDIQSLLAVYQSLKISPKTWTEENLTEFIRRKKMLGMNSRLLNNKEHQQYSRVYESAKELDSSCVEITKKAIEKLLASKVPAFKIVNMIQKFDPYAVNNKGYAKILVHSMDKAKATGR